MAFTLLKTWDASISAEELQFQLGASKCRRNTAGIPLLAGLIGVPEAAERVSFTCTLGASPAEDPAFFSFGIAVAGTITKTDSAVFGVAPGSFGVVENRKRSNNLFVKHNGAMLPASLPKIKAGDVLCACLVHGAAAHKGYLFVNNVEVGTVDLPADGTKFVMGATFPEEHTLSILDQQPPLFVLPTRPDAGVFLAKEWVAPVIPEHQAMNPASHSIKVNNAPIGPDGTFRTCLLCGENFDSKQTIHCAFGHVYCDGCFSDMLKTQMSNPLQFSTTRGNMVCDCCMPHNGATLASQMAKDAADAAADAFAEQGGDGPREAELASAAAAAAEASAQASAAAGESRLFFFSILDVSRHAPQDFDAYYALNLELHHQDKQERERKEAARKARIETIAMAHEGEDKARERRVITHRNAVSDQILTPRCPNCHEPFIVDKEFTNCFALYCDRCAGRRFCGYCLFDAGTNSTTAHDHVRECKISLRKGSYYPPTERPAIDSFNMVRAPIRKAEILTYLAEQVTAADRPFVVAAIERNCNDLGVALDA